MQIFPNVGFKRLLFYYSLFYFLCKETAHIAVTQAKQLLWVAIHQLRSVALTLLPSCAVVVLAELLPALLLHGQNCAAVAHFQEGVSLLLPAH